jgi:hypothetical protein
MQKFSFNPYSTMFVNPSKTIKAIIEYNPKYGFFQLASIFFLQSFFFTVARNSVNLPLNYFLSIILALVLSPFLGAVIFYINSYFLYITGKLLKSNAKFSDVLASYAWSKIVVVIDLIMWLTLFVFIKDPKFFRYSSSVSIVFIDVISIATSIWSFCLLVQSLKVVSNFSTLKAIFNIFLAFLLLFIIIGLIFLLFFNIK